MEETFNAVKAWPESKSVQDIQVFIGFANFYQRFIQGFNKIAALLTSMLKTSLLLTGILPTTGIDDSKVVRSRGRNDKKSAKSDFSKPLHKVEEPSFLTLDTRRVFTELR